MHIADMHWYANCKYQQYYVAWIQTRECYPGLLLWGSACSKFETLSPEMQKLLSFKILTYTISLLSASAFAAISTPTSVVVGMGLDTWTAAPDGIWCAKPFSMESRGVVRSVLLRPLPRMIAPKGTSMVAVTSRQEMEASRHHMSMSTTNKSVKSQTGVMLNLCKPEGDMPIHHKGKETITK